MGYLVLENSFLILFEVKILEKYLFIKSCFPSFVKYLYKKKGIRIPCVIIDLWSKIKIKIKSVSGNSNPARRETNKVIKYIFFNY